MLIKYAMELKEGPSHDGEQFLWIYQKQICLGYLKIILKTEKKLEMEQIYVYPKFRGNNYGKEAIKLLTENKRNEDLNKIVLWAFGEPGSENKLFKYYEELGFKKIGRISTVTVDGLEYTKQSMEYEY